MLKEPARLKTSFQKETKKTGKRLLTIYERLYQAIGPRHWWPGDSPFEVIVGAILTQNTSWKNVETAITALKDKQLLHPAKLFAIDEKRLAKTIQSSGFFNIKAKRIKNFMRFLFDNYGGHLEEMFSEECMPLREKLLSVNGIGPETADSILLYAGGKPVFVVDAYTKKILVRHNLISTVAEYAETQALFMENLKNDAKMFNEYHALLVYVGKYFCKKIPDCERCPMRGL